MVEFTLSPQVHPQDVLPAALCLGLAAARVLPPDLGIDRSAQLLFDSEDALPTCDTLLGLLHAPVRHRAALRRDQVLNEYCCDLCGVLPIRPFRWNCTVCEVRICIFLCS
jgi:hypothetical protein